MAVKVGRRQAVAVLGGTAIAWPLAAWPQNDRVRRIEMLIDLADDDPERSILVRAFRQRLEELGRREGRDIHIVIHYPGDFSSAPAQQQYLLAAKEIVRLRPDVIFAQTTPGVAALDEETRTIPIVLPRALPGRVETSRASPISRRRAAAVGSACSRRSRPGSSAWP
jgi:putative ABC transport system substrate-binding protein